MILILLSLISGFLTAFAPCALPMLPIIVSGSLKDDPHPRRRALIIAISLGASVFAFSLLIKFSSLLLGLSPSFWAKVSGTIIILIGIFNLFPNLWMTISAKLKLMGHSEGNLSKSYQSKSKLEPVLTGIALGPVFSSCNPIYLFIISVLLPKNLATGLINLLAYCLGLSLIMLIIAIGGQKVIAKLKWAVNPKGWFRKGLAVTFILVGLAIFSGLDKKVESWMLQNNSWFTNYVKLEQQVLPED